MRIMSINEIFKLMKYHPEKNIIDVIKNEWYPLENIFDNK